MSLEDELDSMEDGFETEAEQIDEETETEDVESYLDDEVMDPDDLETDLEDAYDDFEDNGGFRGEKVADPHQGRLADLVQDEVGLDLSEEGFHIEGPDGDEPTKGLVDEGAIDDYDAEELADDTEEVTEPEPDDADYGYEYYEMELDEDDILRYIVDDAGNEIGFVILEDGKEQEYYFADDEDTEEEDEDLAEREIAAMKAASKGKGHHDHGHGKGKKSKKDDDDAEYDLGITREGVAAATDDMNTIYKEGLQTAAELKGAFDDIKDALDFSSILKPKK